MVIFHDSLLDYHGLSDPVPGQVCVIAGVRGSASFYSRHRYCRLALAGW